MAVERPVILITGASSGIGEATARRFARAGYRTALAARRTDRLERLAQEIETGGGAALAITADVGQLESIQSMVQTVLDTWGQIDVLFNNAGFGRLDWLDQLDPVNDIEAQIHVNLLGLIQTTRAALPAMIARRRGHIINMSSLAGWVATPTYSVYAASKYGIRGFTEALRREVRCHGIQVSGIYPGGTNTEFAERARIRRRTGVTTPSWLRLEADDVALEVLKLAQRPRRTVILPRLMGWVVGINALAPGLVDWLIEKRFTKREKNKT